MSLKVWLPLNNSLENKGSDDAVVINNGATINSAGKIGNCYSFNGSSNYFKYNKSLFTNATEEFSYACWFKPSATTSGCLFSCRQNVNSKGIAIFVNNSGNILFYAGNTSQSISYTLSANVWYHLAFTYKNGDKKTIYVNGTAINSISSNSLATEISTTNMFIGASQNTNTTVNANYINGSLNDVRIYDHCLSKAEVHELSQGLVLHYKLDDVVNANLLTGNVNVANTWTLNEATCVTDDNALKVTITSDSGNRRIYRGTTNVWTPANSIFTISFDAKAQTDGLLIDVSRSNITTDMTSFTLSTSWKHYKGQIVNTAAVDAGTLSIRCTTNGGIFWIKNVKLERGTVDTGFNYSTYTQTIIADSSGHGYHGTITGALVIEQSTPRYDNCTHIASTSHYIKCASFPTTGFANSYSFSWWSKCNSWSGMMNWGFSNGVRLNGIYNGTLWNTGDGSNNPLYNPGTITQVTAPTTNAWHHFVMTGDGTSCKVYKDGVHWATAKTYKAISGTQIYINGWDSATTYSYSDLSISDFRVYATALSADDISSLYQTEAKVDKGGNIHAREFNIPSSDNIFIPSTVTTGTATVTVSGQTIKIKNDTAKTYSSSQTPLATTLGLVNGHFYKVTCHANFVSGSGCISFRRTSDNGIIASSGWFAESKDVSFIYRYDSSVPTYLSMFSTGSTSTTGEVDYQNVCVQDVSASITNEGIFNANNFIEQGSLLNNATSGSYKPVANVQNSTGCYCQVDFSAFRNSSVPVTFQVEYDVLWSNFAYTSGGTVKTYMQGSNRKIATGGYVWEGSNYIANSTSFVTDIQANSTGSKHISRTTTIPVSWFQTYDASQFGFRTDYSNGNGTIGYSNLKVTPLSTNAKFNKEFILANNFTEM